jgi:mannose-6-phosphate isomerase-like protein (cupin superfamily)
LDRFEKKTLDNTYFRQILFTGQHAQLVVMCLRPGEEIGDGVHPNVDQFFRIEQGEAKFVFNEKEEHRVRGEDAVVVPAGTYHNVINTSKLACGDCRDRDVVHRLFDGARADLVITSPPHASQREYDPASGFTPVPPAQRHPSFVRVADYPPGGRATPRSSRPRRVCR